MRASAACFALNILFFLVAIVSPSEAESIYPLLGSLGSDDLIYRQHQEQLAASYAALQTGKSLPDLLIYEYPVRKTVDLLALAARLNVPYETIATLNGLDRNREFLPGERILAPSMPGLFVPERPGSDLDFLLSYRPAAASVRVVANAARGLRNLRFLPGARFNPEERALFLGFLFRFPLPAAKLTSGFGLRESPITGILADHAGIDLAAAAGTEVYAAREGIVQASGTDAVLGQYIVIEHAGGWSTVYGHLSLRRVRLNEEVESGMIIGNVGSSGLSTGPHLHFEVRNRGLPRDPAALIPRGKR
jgi:murein DD-endopeptidase MepM/ murein hydrolase activator NlpD